jgi:hypothetical protein
MTLTTELWLFCHTFGLTSAQKHIRQKSPRGLRGEFNHLLEESLFFYVLIMYETDHLDPRVKILTDGDKGSLFRRKFNATTSDVKVTDLWDLVEKVLTDHLLCG